MKPVAIILCLALGGCAAMPTATAASATSAAQPIAASCGAQLSMAMVVNSGTAVGTLDVQVVDQNGVVRPGASIQLVGPNQSYHIQCLQGAAVATGTNGTAHLERMIAGNYRVSAFVTVDGAPMTADGFVRIAANQTNSLTLVVKPAVTGNGPTS